MEPVPDLATRVPAARPACTCSTGRPGHRTPAGVFVILEKDKNHHSSTYDNAPMPYMERLTWGGVALHAGNLPGYPASHGCVRLPLEFAKLLFGVTTLGTPVVMADGDVAATDFQHPGLLISHHLEDMAREAVNTVAAKSAHPVSATKETHQASSFVVSTADRKLIAFINGRISSIGERKRMRKVLSPARNHALQSTRHSRNILSVLMSSRSLR